MIQNHLKFDRFFFALLSVGLACAAPAAATTYYISPTGNDGYPGTSKTQPIQSFWTANHRMQAGDTLALLPGIYPNFGVGVSGLPGKPTIITAAEPTQKPKIVGNIYPAVWVQANYVTISNLDVTTGQLSLAAGLQIYQSNHVTVENVVAHDSGGGGIMAGYSDYITFNRNVVYNNSRAASNQTSGISLGLGVNSDTNPGTHNVIANNISYNNMDIVPCPGTNYTTDGNGIIIDTLDGLQPFVGNTLVYNNLVYNNGGSGIRMFHSSNVYVTNNTSVGNLQGATLSGLKAEISSLDGSGNVVRNNVVQVTKSSAYALLDAGANGNVYDYNLTNGGMPAQRFTYQSNADWGSHNLFGRDPQFQAGNNFMVASTSPALGHALGRAAPLRDIRGVLRPADHVGVDLGAYQQSE